MASEMMIEEREIAARLSRHMHALAVRSGVEDAAVKEKISPSLARDLVGADGRHGKIRFAVVPVSQRTHEALARNCEKAATLLAAAGIGIDRAVKGDSHDGTHKG